MNIIIACAGSKHQTGSFTSDNKQVVFVARPDMCKPDGAAKFVRPDDMVEPGKSWRDQLNDYNEKYRSEGANPLCFLPAWKLYKPDIYGELKERFGVQNLFILSAGWGLVRSDFLLPSYDITFSAQADRHKRRRPSDTFQDYLHFPADKEVPAVFFAGKDYGNFLGRLAKHPNSNLRPRANFHIWYNTPHPPDMAGYSLCDYGHHNHSTNWHYTCAKNFMDRTISV